ncbi:MAG: glutamine-synthetase adenylyltransferase, partial [Pseudomonadota bacterium]
KGGLESLALAGWVPESDAAQLYDHYRHHREVEHRLQMINDAQTHSLPADDRGFARLAAFMGTDVNLLRRDLHKRLEAVHQLTEGFFAPEATATKASTDFGAEVISRWHSYPALRSSRATEIFARLQPEILTRLQEAAKPEEALNQFDSFLSGLPAGVQLFSLFEANPSLTQLIVDICATAPALAQYLSRNAGVLDVVIGGSFFADWPGEAALADELSATLETYDDYEGQLLATRRWAREWHFRIGVHHLRGLIDAGEAGRQYADLAQAVLCALWPKVVGEFARKYGDPPGRGGCVLAMGSLGAGQLTAASDLDLIMIYDPQGVEQSDGPRPLATRPYYARLTQALVTALSAPMAEGRLYEVDMRLRPSGRQGPVATALESFQVYQREEAWTWEHLALTRARPIAGDPDLRAEIDALRAQIIAEKAEGVTIIADVADMRRRIADAKKGDGPFDPKVGRGRLQDIELFAQTAALRAGVYTRDVAQQLQAGVACSWLNAADAQALTEAGRLWWAMQATSRLLTGSGFPFADLAEGAKRMILRETGAEDMAALQDTLLRSETEAAGLIDGYLSAG